MAPGMHSQTSVTIAIEKLQPTPIWLAALFAAGCSADDGDEGHAVEWSCISGRAVYTNDGANAERIEPLGVKLFRGQTLAVYWMPGETAYTTEVYSQTEMRASELSKRRNTP
jgi:hypothetical protein